jgi:hypothetical protein
MVEVMLSADGALVPRSGATDLVSTGARLTLLTSCPLDLTQARAHARLRDDLALLIDAPSARASACSVSPKTGSSCYEPRSVSGIGARVRTPAAVPSTRPFCSPLLQDNLVHLTSIQLNAEGVTANLRVRG